MANLLVQDAVMLFLAMWLASFLRFGTLFPEISFIEQFREAFYPQLFPALLVIWLIVFMGNRLYDYDYLFWGSGEFSRVASSITTGLVILVVATFAVRLYGISRAWMLMSGGFAFVFVTAARLWFRWLVAFLRRTGIRSMRTLIVGCNEEARVLMLRAVRVRSAGLLPVGYVCGHTSPRTEMDDLPELGQHHHLDEVVTRNGIDCVLIASSDFTHKHVTDMVRQLRGLELDIHISSGLFEILTSRVLVKEVAGVPLITVRRVAMTGWGTVVKRVFDLALGAFSLSVFSPLLVALAVAVKMTSRGPVFYKQERIGRDGRRFFMYKFRSMVANADPSIHEARVAEQIAAAIDDAPAEASANTYKGEDVRVTAVGHWMRKFSLDELPQLFNVLRGEMSLVGPRPPLPYEVDRYEEWMLKRLEVIPGMTGLWQVSGRADIPYNEMVKLDIYYIENWSPRLDFSILLRTIPVVLFPKGAY